MDKNFSSSFNRIHPGAVPDAVHAEPEQNRPLGRLNACQLKGRDLIGRS
jgi:hypothetical protein